MSFEFDFDFDPSAHALAEEMMMGEEQFEVVARTIANNLPQDDDFQQVPTELPKNFDALQSVLNDAASIHHNPSPIPLTNESLDEKDKAWLSTITESHASRVRYLIRQQQYKRNKMKEVEEKRCENDNSSGSEDESEGNSGKGETGSDTDDDETPPHQTPQKHQTPPQPTPQKHQTPPQPTPQKHQTPTKQIPLQQTPANLLKRKRKGATMKQLPRKRKGCTKFINQTFHWKDINTMKCHFCDYVSKKEKRDNVARHMARKHGCTIISISGDKKDYLETSRKHQRKRKLEKLVPI